MNTENFIKDGTLYIKGGSVPLKDILTDLDISLEAVRHRLNGRTAWRKLECDVLRREYGIEYNELRNELYKDQD